MIFKVSTIEIVFILNAAALAAVLTVVLYNFFTAVLVPEFNAGFKAGPLVSVLIPARNEEKTITRCVNSILNQTYKDIEIIVLNDQSDDGTMRVLEQNYGRNRKVVIINGKPLPHGWTGKNWACSQLSEAARGEILLFIDADVELSDEALAKTMNILSRLKVDMLSCFPDQRISSLGESLVVPLMNFLLLAFLPLRKVYSSANISFTAANGQFLLFTRKAYNAVGGHGKVKDKVVEDMELARNIKREKFKTVTVIGGNDIRCRMYGGLKSAVKGFSKNFYPGFNTSPAVFILMVTVIPLLFMLPLVLPFFYPAYLIPFCAVVLIRLLISSIGTGLTLRDVYLHPLQMIMFFAVGINSLISNKLGTVEWKGRSI